MALVGVGVDNVDSSAMVEAIVGDNLVDLRSDLRGFTSQLVGVHDFIQIMLKSYKV